jgi:GTPase SAR1 family protein
MGKRIKLRKSLMLPVDSFDSDSRLRVLGVIDRLRELGVSEDVSLPQVRKYTLLSFISLLTAIKLVVVGDQSSGKSSVLEALTGLSFPIASDLCTRHATQIELRRASAEDAAVKITIIPGPTARTNDEVKERLLNFERRLPVDQFGPAEFTRIFDEVGNFDLDIR